MRIVLGLILAVLLAGTAAAQPGASGAAALWAGEAQSSPAAPGPRESLRIAQRFNCANVSCKKLGSCEEACYKLLVCGQKIRDKDGDGIPCENLCSRPCPR